MDLKTKHRVIGVIVIVALAVILVPLLFTKNSHDKTPALSSDMPSAPNSSATTPLSIQPQSSADTTNNNAAANNNDVNGAALTESPQQSADNTTPSNTPEGDASSNTAAAANTGNNPAAVVAANNAADQSAAAAYNAAIESTSKTTQEQTTTPAAKPVKHTTHEKSAVHHHKTQHHTTAHHKPVKAAAKANAWAIHLASFNEKANAEKLVKKLRAKGFPAYIHEAHADNTAMVRVFVGPELNKTKAETLRKKLHEEFRLEGVVVKYQV